MTNAPNMYEVVKDWSQYKSYFQSMHSYAANGDTTGLENVKSQLANEVVNVYLNDGDDSTNIDYEGAMSFVNMVYAQYSSENPVQQNTSASTGMTAVTGTPNMYEVVHDWSQYRNYFQSMHSYAANGDTTGLENVKSQLANEVVNVYLNDGDDSTNIDYEGAMSFVNMVYAQYSSENPVQRNTSANTGNTGSGATGAGNNFNASANTGNTGSGATGTENNFNTSTPTGMTAGVVEWGTYDTQIQIMYNRLMGNNEKEALAMRQQMAASIMDAYNSDDDAENDITMDQALSYVDVRYQQANGQSIVATIGETTKGADSFWNKVPIVSWFIDNTTAEDLYEYMEDGENAEMKNKKANEVADAPLKGLITTTAVAAAGTWAVSTAVAVKGGTAIGTAICPGVGTLIGAGVGLVVGLATWGISKLINNK